MLDEELQAIGAFFTLDELKRETHHQRKQHLQLCHSWHMENHWLRSRISRSDHSCSGTVIQSVWKFSRNPTAEITNMDLTDNLKLTMPIVV